MKATILVVEDDPHILLGLREVLESDGFHVETCSRGDEVKALLVERLPAMILLDVMLPGMSGYEVCKQVRARGLAVPILMLTAKGQELDKVVGLELGADDYVTKPFGVRELLARIHALLRRSGGMEVGEVQVEFSIGEAVIDPKTFTIRRGAVTDPLTARELKLLQIFHAKPGEVLSRERLLTEVWGYEYYGTTRTLDQTIVQLRKKLGEHGAPRHLLTVHGVGYRLSP